MDEILVYANSSIPLDKINSKLKEQSTLKIKYSNSFKKSLKSIKGLFQEINSKIENSSISDIEFDFEDNNYYTIITKKLKNGK